MSFRYKTKHLLLEKMSLLLPMNKKSTKSVIMFIKHFSIVFKLTDREVTIVNETNFLDIFLLFNKFLSSN